MSGRERARWAWAGVGASGSEAGIGNDEWGVGRGLGGQGYGGARGRGAEEQAGAAALVARTHALEESSAPLDVLLVTGRRQRLMQRLHVQPRRPVARVRLHVLRIDALLDLPHASRRLGGKAARHLRRALVLAPQCQLPLNIIGRVHVEPTRKRPRAKVVEEHGRAAAAHGLELGLSGCVGTGRVVRA